MPEIRDGLLVPPEERPAAELERQRKTFSLVCMGKGYQALRSLRRVVPARGDRLPEGTA